MPEFEAGNNVNNMRNNIVGTPRQLARRKPARGCEPTSEKLSSQLFLLFPTRLSVTDGDTTRTFTCHADGQLASASCDGIGRAGAHASSDIASQCSLRSGDMRTPQTETFLWDGLALVRRGDEQFINEPHVGGGNPVASSKGTSYFNDALGTTVGAKKDGKYSAAALTAFGERLDNVDSTSPAIRSLGEGWFTGKPFVEGLGHTFLMRNYRASLAKWQTADPMGYPDGWNQVKYGFNSPVCGVDDLGCFWIDVEASTWISKECSDLVVISKQGSPLHTGIPKSLFSALSKLIINAIKHSVQEHPDLQKLVDAYINAADWEVGSDPVTPSDGECIAAINRIMEPLGYEWEYVGKEMFDVDYSATVLPNAIQVEKMKILWKIKYTYKVWVEE